MIGEGGDDIFVGSDGPDKLKGMSGFDWATYKDDRFGVDVDFLPSFDEDPVPLSGRGDRPARVRRGGRPVRVGVRTTSCAATTSDAATIATDGAPGQRTHQHRADRRPAGVPRRGVVTSVRRGQHHPGRRRQRHDRGPRRRRPDRRRQLVGRPHQRAPNADGTGAEIRSVNSLIELVSDMVDGNINPGQLQIVREIIQGRQRLRHRHGLFSGTSAELHHRRQYATGPERLQ